MSRTLLIDGDILCYKAAIVSEEAVDWGDGLWTLWAFEEQALRFADAALESLQETLEADAFIVALTDGANWRLSIMPDYKGNRKDVRKPLLLPVVRQHLLDNYNTYLRDTLEGDDILGILATHPKLVKGEKIIVSLDKDMHTIPGLLYNDGKPKNGIMEITEEAADYWHMVQALAGDPTDGYSGCPGIGVETAQAILSDPHRLVREEYTVSRGKNKGEQRHRWVKGDPCSLWEAVVDQYRKAGLGEAEALRNARVARILRYTDYDFKAKKVRPWVPPQTESK